MWIAALRLRMLIGDFSTVAAISGRGRFAYRNGRRNLNIRAPAPAVRQVRIGRHVNFAAFARFRER